MNRSRPTGYDQSVTANRYGQPCGLPTCSRLYPSSEVYDMFETDFSVFSVVKK